MTKHCIPLHAEASRPCNPSVTDRNYYKISTFLVELCSGLQVNCYYFEEDDAWESPRVGSPENWVEESEHAEVSPYMGTHYNQSHFYLVLGTKGKPVTTPRESQLATISKEHGHPSA